ncbi:serine hydroxymethyltransferase [Candidatus Saccharibacteria bacterium]|nr:serine hydroxymethyltransferase [Candidatus Saccharibacteria bacterium]
MSFSIIACIGKRNELGKDNELIFRFKEDMQFFRKTTMGHSVVMGYNTWLSLGEKPLRGRTNFVLSRKSLNLPAGVHQITNLSDFISKYKSSPEEVFVIGGASVYAQMLPHAATLYLTEVDASCPSADAFFPSFRQSFERASNFRKNSASKSPKTGANCPNFAINKYIRKEPSMDPVFTLIKSEETRQKEGLELIPSENYVSPEVMRAAGSVLTNKYSEGYPSFIGVGKDGEFWQEDKLQAEILPNYRYYGGQENIDRIERLAISRACRLFHADHANVQPHSGANANEAVYWAWCRPGDTILAMSLPAGGHLTHGSPVTRSANIYNFVAYGVDSSGDIDYAELERVALAEHPKIILVGYSAFMKIPNFDRVAKIAKKIPDCLLMADMAHVAGLIAGGVHPNPLDHGFHVMTTTTHKTLRGPRGGLILSKGNVASPLKKPEYSLKNIPILIDRAVFPGTQGGPLEHIIAAKAVAFGEALRPEFKTYAKQIVKNAKALAAALQKQGFRLQGGGTENHLILIDVKGSFGIDGKFYEKALDYVGLNLNANSLPTDQGAAFRPSGVRLGTPAITTRGLAEPEMAQIALWMRRVIDICVGLSDESRLPEAADELADIKQEVKSLALRFPAPTA